jgi:hypothetical protein
MSVAQNWKSWWGLGIATVPLLLALVLQGKVDPDLGLMPCGFSFTFEVMRRCPANSFGWYLPALLVFVFSFYAQVRRPRGPGKHILSIAGCLLGSSLYLWLVLSA